MAQVYSSRSTRQSRYARRRNRVGVRVAFIAFLGVAAFAAGFILLWSLGSWLAGGVGFPWRSSASPAVAPVQLTVDTEYTVEPLMDLVAMRDLSYTPVKAVYVTGMSAGYTKKLKALLALADATEINSFVINVKDDAGKLTYAADVPLAKTLGLIEKQIPDIDALMDTLSKHHIIPIARLVCFKDDTLARARPDLAVMSSKGGMWKDYKGFAYTNPYNHEVWDYLVRVAEDAAKHGFREIQFDYVRFPTDGPISECVYPGKYCSREDCIAGFLAYAHQRLEKLGVWVSADVFGIVIEDTPDTATIGQKIGKIASNVDIVCPMVYPSHYADGSYGLDSPNASPYDLVTAAMKETTMRLEGTGAMGRPWLQDFTLGVPYGVEQVKSEITAAEKQDYKEWILWNASNNYTQGALRSESG